VLVVAPKIVSLAMQQEHPVLILSLKKAAELEAEPLLQVRVQALEGFGL
jgi:hypothetical protein